MAAASGRLEVLCGSMFAGKTTMLIDRLEAARRSGLRVVAIKHAIDDRYHNARLVTHNGRGFDAVSATGPSDVLERAVGADVVGLDEGHFFGRGLVAVVKALLSRGVRVIIAGLENDAWGRPFPPFPHLRELAAEVVELRSPCTICGAPSPYSQRMVPVTDEFMVGGVGDYQPRCAAHFEPLPEPAPQY